MTRTEKEDLPALEEVLQDLKGFGIPCEGPPRLEPLAGDAGGRRYVRVRTGKERTLLLMLVPEREDRERGATGTGEELPYLNVQRYLAGLGLPVPGIYGWEPRARRLYHEDFGPRRLSQAAREAADPLPLYAKAVDLLMEMQRRTAAPDPACLAFRRRFDEKAIRSELAEFAEHGIPHVAKRPPTPKESRRLGRELDQLAAAVAALPACFSHRDWHADNLLVRPDGTLGIIDFQDAFIAPRTYDLASLLTDREAPEILGWERVEALASRGAPGREGEFWIAALQRQMKVAGRFVSLERRGKPGYLRHLPVTWRAVSKALPLAGRLRLQELLASLGCPV